MGDPAKKYHGPNNNVTMQPVDTPENTGSNKRTTNFEQFKNSIQDPTENKEFAFTEKRIEENYPFFGTLLKKENGVYRRKDTFDQENAITIEDVERKYESGYYKVRIKGKEDDLELEFRIDENIDNSVSSPEELKEQSVSNIGDQLQAHYESTIQLQEKRIESLRAELDRKSSKVRELKEEGFEDVQKAEERHRQERDRLQRKIDELKDEKRELKFENFELNQELKFADQSNGFSIQSLFDQLLSDDGLLAKYGPMIVQQMNQQQKQAALNGTIQQSSQQPRSNPQAQQQNSQQNQQNDQMSQQTASKEDIAQSVVDKIFGFAQHALQNDEVGPEQIQQVIGHQEQELRKHGLALEAKDWINIAKALIKFVDAKGIAHERLADVIQPLLQNLGAAKNALQYIQAEKAADMLQEQFGFDCNENEREILVRVLEEFKNRLSG